MDIRGYTRRTREGNKGKIATMNSKRLGKIGLMRAGWNQGGQRGAQRLRVRTVSEKWR